MHPVLSREEIQISELNRRHRLAAAERKRMIKTAEVTPGIATPTASLRRIRDGLSGAVPALLRFRGASDAPLRDESVAMQSA